MNEPTTKQTIALEIESAFTATINRRDTRGRYIVPAAISNRNTEIGAVGGLHRKSHNETLQQPEDWKSSFFKFTPRAHLFSSTTMPTNRLYINTNTTTVKNMASADSKSSNKR
jgi:hypothetical protein